jgi:hypothetical protein
MRTFGGLFENNWGRNEEEEEKDPKQLRPHLYLSKAKEGWKHKAYNLSVFRLELRNQLAIFMQCEFFPNQILSNELLPKGKIV